MTLPNLRVANKLRLAFGLGLAMTVVLSTFAVDRMRSIYAAGDLIASNWLPSVTALADVRNALDATRQAQSQLLLASSRAQRDAERSRFLDASRALENAQLRYAKLIHSDEERAKYRRFETLAAAYFGGSVKINALVMESDYATAEAVRLYFQDNREAFRAVSDAIAELIAFNAATSAADVARARRQLEQAQAMIAGALVLTLVAGALFARTITRSINASLSLAVEENARIAEGDLTGSVDGYGRHDEFGRLLDSAAAMRGSLRRVAKEVSHGVSTIATASSQIAAGAADLRLRSAEQASRLQQAAASLGQLSGTVGHNAQSAHEGHRFAASAREVATRGGEIVSRVVYAMDEIAARSHRVSEITATIDTIAFQTNILALNAAVEAARAGEQGRGFATVAHEVRQLAQRSARAAREIKALVGASIEGIAVGSTLASEAGTTMGEIETHVHRVNELMNEISAASTEQATGLVQVNEAVASIDATTRKNAVMVEASAASAASLEEQATRLRTLLESFRLDDSRTQSGTRVV